MIAILNYGMGNLGSMANMFRYLGIDAVITSSPDVLADASHLILPGVGSFDAAMEKLASQTDLIPMLTDLVMNKGLPTLGVCLGMQLLLESSEEGASQGLGWIQGRVRKFASSQTLKVPHMGWNDAQVASKGCRLTKGLPETTRYYFVHSFYAEPAEPSSVMFRTEYGAKFASGVFKDNVFGVQFHPEKSHRFGMALLKNFASL